MTIIIAILKIYIIGAIVSFILTPFLDYFICKKWGISYDPKFVKTRISPKIVLWPFWLIYAITELSIHSIGKIIDIYSTIPEKIFGKKE